MKRGVRIALVLIGMVITGWLLSAVAGQPVGAWQSPLSPPYTPLPWRPTPAVEPTPTERPTPGPEPGPAETTATPPVVLDAPMARLCPAVTPAPVRVLRWTWRAE